MSAINVFIASTQKDQPFLAELVKHLVPLKNNGTLHKIWHEGELLAGEEREIAIRRELQQAQLVLLLLSVDFLNSDYISKDIVRQFVKRQQANELTILPVLIRACAWHQVEPLAGLKILFVQNPLGSVTENQRDAHYDAITEVVKKAAFQQYQKMMGTTIQEDWSIEEILINSQQQQQQQQSSKQNRTKRLKLLPLLLAILTILIASGLVYFNFQALTEGGANEIEKLNETLNKIRSDSVEEIAKDRLIEEMVALFSPDRMVEIVGEGETIMEENRLEDFLAMQRFNQDSSMKVVEITAHKLILKYIDDPK